jgi:hypothetical protein
MKPFLVSVIAACIVALGVVQAAERPQADSDFEAKLPGVWKGGPCRGILQISADGTFERRHYSPGDNELSGTWTLQRNELPPTLILTCKASNDPEQFPVDRTWELKVVRLDAETLAYESPAETRVEYRRMTEREEGADRLSGLVVHGKMTQVIGRFSSHGGPEAGDSFELDLSHLPQEKIELTRPGEEKVASYMPLSAPLAIERLSLGKRRDSPARAAIDLATTDGSRKLRIRIVTDGLETGSRVRILLRESDDFLGSMAEAVGTLE